MLPGTWPQAVQESCVRVAPPGCSFVINIRQHRVNDCVRSRVQTGSMSRVRPPIVCFVFGALAFSAWASDAIEDYEGVGYEAGRQTDHATSLALTNTLDQAPVAVWDEVVASTACHIPRGRHPLRGHVHIDGTQLLPIRGDAWSHGHVAVEHEPFAGLDHGRLSRRSSAGHTVANNQNMCRWDVETVLPEHYGNSKSRRRICGWSTV